MESIIKKLITIFLIQLVSTIPFYAADVYAAGQITSVIAKGKDGINGFRKSNDAITFIVKANIDGNSISKDNLLLGSSIKFAKCEPATTTGSECEVRYPITGTKEITSKSSTYTINLVNDEQPAKLLHSIGGSVIVDKQPPKISTLTTSKTKYSSTDTISISYLIDDVSCIDSTDDSCTEHCVGIKEIEFTSKIAGGKDGPFNQKVELNKEPDDCSEQNTISISKEDTDKFADGTNSIFAKATDNFGFSSLKSVSFSMDKTGPSIIENSFKIMKGGVELSTFSPNEVDVDVLVSVSADDLEVDSVKADLSELNPDVVGEQTATCSQDTVKNDLYKCKWTIKLKPATESATHVKKIVITASDLIGNTKKSTISKSLSKDDKGPKVLSLSTGIVVNEKILAKLTGNKVTATLEETTGLSKENVLLHIGTDTTTGIAAKSCTKTGSNWVCEWEGTDVVFTTNQKMSIGTDTTDVLNNPVKENTEVEVIVDNQAPVLKGDIRIVAVGGGSTQPIPNIFNIVTATFNDIKGLSKEISKENVLLHIGTDTTTGIAAKSCTKTGSNWVCEWENALLFTALKNDLAVNTPSSLKNALITPNTNVRVTVSDKGTTKQTTLIGEIMIELIGLAKPIFSIGDKLIIETDVIEKNDVFAVGDFSKFISGASSVNGVCDRKQPNEKNEHVCKWEIEQQINLAASGNIKLTFTDNAGNKLEQSTRQLTTFGLEKTEVPDFWSNQVTCSPSTIDRQLGPLINQRVFCQVTLTKKDPEEKNTVETVLIDNPTCVGDGIGVLDNVEAFNTQSPTTSPIIKLTLKKIQFNIDEAKLTCSLNILSKVGGTITKNPEIENVDINLLFYNLPLGELADGVQDKIDEAKKDVQHSYKVIGQANKLFEISKKICNLISTFYTLVGTFYLITTILKGAALTCTATVIGNVGICQALEIAGTSQCGGTEAGKGGADATKKFLGGYCDFVNCKQAKLWGPNVKKFINDLPGKNYLPKDKEIADYLDPQHNIISASLFACLPGIVYSLEKLRQIDCLYIDCLENAVAKNGLPITACEDLKEYSTCKYFTGELFVLVPYTFIFNHFLGIIKQSISNPFSLLGVAVSVACGSTCPLPDGGGSYTACRLDYLLDLIGDAAQNVKYIINDGFKVREDYCSRINFD